MNSNSNSVIHDISWAVKKLDEGHKVRRKDWPEPASLFLVKTNWGKHIDSTYPEYSMMAFCSFDTLKATDWELADWLMCSTDENKEASLVIELTVGQSYTPMRSLTCESHVRELRCPNANRYEVEDDDYKGAQMLAFSIAITLSFACGVLLCYCYMQAVSM